MYLCYPPHSCPHRVANGGRSLSVFTEKEKYRHRINGRFQCKHNIHDICQFNAHADQEPKEFGFRQCLQAFLYSDSPRISTISCCSAKGICRKQGPSEKSRSRFSRSCDVFDAARLFGCNEVVNYIGSQLASEKQLLRRTWTLASAL